MLIAAAVPPRFQKASVFLACLAFAGGSLLLVTAPSWQACLIGAFTVGLGYGITTMAYLNRVASGFGERSGSVTNLLNAMWGVGAIVGPAFVSRAVLDTSSPFAVSVVIASLTAVPVLFAITPLEPRIPDDKGDSPSVPKMTMALFVILFVVYTAAEVAVGVFSAAHIRSLGYSVEEAARSSSLFWIGMLVGRLFVALQPKPFEPRAVVSVASLSGLIVVMATAIPPFAPWGLLILGLCWGPLFPTSFVWSNRACLGSAVAASVIVGASSLGAVLSPKFIGPVILQVGLPISLLVLAGLHFGTVLLIRRQTA